MKILDIKSKDFYKTLDCIAKGQTTAGNIASIVNGVIDDVRTNGDKAVEKLTAKFDGVDLKAKYFKVSKQ